MIFSFRPMRISSCCASEYKEKILFAEGTNSYFVLYVVKESVCKEKAEELADIFGRKEHLKKYPYQLSGGKKQHGAACRALIISPEIIFVDEEVIRQHDTVQLRICILVFDAKW